MRERAKRASRGRSVVALLAHCLAALLALAPVAHAVVRAPAAALTALPRAAWLAQGKGTRIVYVFFDPNSRYCMRLYRALQPLIAPERLQVRWVPVAIMDPTSLGRAGAILEADDPVAALRANEDNYDARARRGGLAQVPPSLRTTSLLRMNERLLERAAAPRVPTLIFRADNGRVVVVQRALSRAALRKLLRRVRG